MDNEYKSELNFKKKIDPIKRGNNYYIIFHIIL